jgi:alpha-L-arabinofuranosidase
MTGLERNSDVVAMCCYAPLFAFEGEHQWNPNLIGFDHLTSYGSPSYWAQKLFAANIGDHYLPTESTDDDLHCSATLDTASGTVFLKLVNTTARARTTKLRFVASDVTQAATQVLTGEPTARNSLIRPDLIALRPGNLTGTGGIFEYEVPAYSATVVTC